MAKAKAQEPWYDEYMRLRTAEFDRVKKTQSGLLRPDQTRQINSDSWQKARGDHFRQARSEVEAAAKQKAADAARSKDSESELISKLHNAAKENLEERTPTKPEVVTWVSRNIILDLYKIEPATVPEPAAIAMLIDAKRDPDKFWARWMAFGKQEEAGESQVEDGMNNVDMIDRIKTAWMADHGLHSYAT